MDYFHDEDKNTETKYERIFPDLFGKNNTNSNKLNSALYEEKNS